MTQNNSTFEKSVKPARNKTEKAFETKPKDKAWQRNNDKRKLESV